MSIQRIEKAERRIKTVEDAIVLLTELTDNHNDLLENFLYGLDELRANQKNTDEKMNALIDAQIVSEDKLELHQDRLERIEASHERFVEQNERFREQNQRYQEQSEKEMQDLRETMKDLMLSIKIVNQKIEQNKNE